MPADPEAERLALSQAVNDLANMLGALRAMEPILTREEVVAVEQGIARLRPVMVSARARHRALVEAERGPVGPARKDGDL